MFLSDNVISETLFWLCSRYIEILATLFGFLYLIYSVEGKKQLWFYGLIASSFYIYICFVYRIYADMGINIYYVIVSIYGWIHWSVRQASATTEIRVVKTKPQEAMLILVSIIVLFLIIAWILKTFTDSDIYFLDAFTTSVSIIATWMLARKMLEHWLLWIVVDAVSVGLYIYKGLYPTSVLFLVYTVIAILGYYEWKRKCQLQIQIS